jgi:NLI interacting factor-like phosphatase
MEVMRRIAFDLDETLGVPIIQGSSIIGWQLRSGCLDLLARLQKRFALCLWTVSNRRYVNKIMQFGLDRWFSEIYTWDEMPVSWKDVRRIQADYLVDDSAHHQEEAKRHGLARSYIIVPSYGSPADLADPLAWVRMVDAAVEQSSRLQ